MTHPAPRTTTPDPQLARAQAVAQIARSLPDEARAFMITSHARFEEAGTFLVLVKRRRQAIAEAFKPVIAAALKAHREALALLKQADAPAEEAERIIKQAMATYQTEQERQRQEAERRAAEAERRREAAQRAERERLQREAEAVAEAEKIAAAERALDAGDDALAEHILESPAAPIYIPEPAPLVPEAVDAPELPKAAGVSFRQQWTYRIVDPAAIDRRFLMPNEKAIAQVVRALGPEAVTTVGGIDVYADTVVAARGR